MLAIQDGTLALCNCAKCLPLNSNFSFLWPCLECGFLLGTDEFTCRNCDLCSQCCLCWTCTRCVRIRDGHRDTPCDQCERCTICCTCVICIGCNARYAPPDDDEELDDYPVCPDCDYCREACGCQCVEIRQRNEENNRLARMSARDRARERAKKDMAGYRERVMAPLKFHRNEDGTEDRYILYNSDGLKFFRARPSQFRRNLSHRYLSAELEVANLNMRGDARGGHPINNKVYQDAIAGEWGAKVVEDMSMPTPVGHEINTAPASGDLFCNQVEYICGELLKRDATCINLTDASKWIRPCGLHVHVDARNYSYEDLRRLLFIYEKIEPEIFQILPGYRRKSHFSAPIGSVYGNALRNPKAFLINGKEKVKGSDLARHAIIQTTYGQREANRHNKRSCPQSTRYGALNLHAFFYRGTLEFRMMYGTVIPDEIIPWAMLCAFIVDAGYRMKEGELAEFLALPSAEALEKIASRSQEVAEFCKTQRERFSIPQQIRESPRLGEVELSERSLYTEADVLLPIPDRKKQKISSIDLIAVRLGEQQLIPNYEAFNADNANAAAIRWYVGEDGIENRE
jgi:hypothetical protein